MIGNRLLSPRLLIFGPILLLVVLGLACGEDATPTPTATPAVQPTPTPTVQSTPQPTATPAVQPVGKRGGVPPFQIGWIVEAWDPHTSTSGNPMTYIAPLFNGLVEFDPTTDDQSDIRGDLATSWDLADDGVTYTFNLNENANWWDGKPVTAEDVVFSLDRMTAEGEPRPRVSVLKPFYKSSRAMDDKTVEITTQFLFPVFLPYLSSEFMKIVPKHHVETGVDISLRENILGSGAFQVKSHEKDISVEYARNPNYWKEGLPYFDGQKSFIITSPGKVFAAFKAGQVWGHLNPTSKLSTAEAQRLGEESQDINTIYWGGPSGHLYLSMNLQRAPFDDKRVRRALWLLPHRQPIIQILSGGKNMLGGPWPPHQWFGITEDELITLPGFRELNGEKHPEDIKEAIRLLKEAGFDKSNPLKTHALVATAGDYTRIAEIWSDQANRFTDGIVQIEVRTGERSARQELARNLAYDMKADGWGINIVDPHDYFAGTMVKSSPANATGWTHPRMEEIFQEQMRERDLEKRAALIREAALILLTEDTYMVSFFWNLKGMIFNNQIKNFHPPGGFSPQLGMEHLWCDPPTCSS